MSISLHLFFSELLKDLSSEQERIFRLLFARGFFIEYKDSFHSLNAIHTPKDHKDLASTLKLFKLGHIQDSAIVLFPQARASQLFVAFEGKRQIAKDCAPLTYDDDVFFDFNTKSKAETLLLEPFIASYVSALNVVGMHTLMLCDGNHTKQPITRMSICFLGRFDRLFHEALMQGIASFKVLPKLSWKRHNGHEIGLNYTLANKEHTYLALQNYARFIVENEPLITKAKLQLVEHFKAQDKKNVKDDEFLTWGKDVIIKNLLLR